MTRFVALTLFSPTTAGSRMDPSTLRPLTRKRKRTARRRPGKHEREKEADVRRQVKLDYPFYIEVMAEIGMFPTPEVARATLRAGILADRLINDTAPRSAQLDEAEILARYEASLYEACDSEDLPSSVGLIESIPGSSFLTRPWL
ncbi:hypothetical protein B0H11DRAFT_355815, partial [Mycena galericulata]